MPLNYQLAVQMLKDERIVDLYKVARFTYKVGDPIIEDTFYNDVEDMVKQGNLSDLVNQSYDDDPEPTDLLIEFNLDYLKYTDEEIGSSSPYYKYLDSEKSMSIKALENYTEAYNYFMSFPDEDKIISPKENGWNYKCLFLKHDPENINNSLELAMTRGRHSSGWNVTKQFSRVIPKTLKTESSEVVLYGEGIVEQSKVKEIRRKNGEKFTSARMAAGSMFRTGCLDESDFRYLHYYVFNADNIDSTISGTLEELKKQGFDTVPFRLVKPGEVPKDFDKFVEWLKELMDNFYKIILDLDMSTDGLVVDLDNKLVVTNQANQYSDRNCALKFEYWSQKYYKGKIVDIEIKQQEVYNSVVILIDPITTDDTCAARRISSYNVGVLVELDVSIGDEVYFERNSEAINVVLRGEKLKNAMGLNYNGNSAIKESSSFLQ